MVSPSNVAIFWDFENCRPPSSTSGYYIADKIRRIASPFGAIKLFKAYVELNSEFLSARSYAFQSELQSSGVSLTHCPHNGRKDVADKMLIVDMLAFAIDHRTPTTFVLISGDRDYAYAASILRLRGYEVVVILPSAVSHVSLKTQASILFEWQRDVLGNRRFSHSSKEDASGQQGCSSGAVSSEMAMVSPSNVVTACNNIPGAFAPAAPSLPHSGLPSSTAMQSTSSDTNENNVDIASSANFLDPPFAGNTLLEENFRSSCDCCGKHTRTSEVGNYCVGEFGRDRHMNDDDIRTRRLLPDPMRHCGPAVQPLEASFSQRTTSRDLVEERPSNDIELVESESHRRTHGVNVNVMETEGYEHVPYLDHTHQTGHSEAGTDGSPHDGNGALRRRPSLSDSTFPPLVSSLRSAIQTDTTTGINITADLTGMDKPGVLLRETHNDAVIAVLPASRDKEFNNCNPPTPPADSHDVDTSSGEFSGGSCNAPHRTLSSPPPSSLRSKEEASIAEYLTRNGGIDASLEQSASTTPCGSPIQTTLNPHAIDFEYSQTSPLPVMSPASTQRASSRTNQRASSPAQGHDARFSILVECFQTRRSENETTAIRSSELATMLLRRDPHAYTLAGVHRLKDYIDSARSSGIVISPGLNKNGDAWIEINPHLYSSNQVEFEQTQASPYNATTSLSPTPPIERTTTNSVIFPQIMAATVVPEPFVPLVLLLKQISPSPRRILFSLLGSLIRQKYPGLYGRAGVSGLRPYLERARSMGIVTLGALESIGKQWVQLVDAHQAV